MTSESNSYFCFTVLSNDADMITQIVLSIFSVLLIGDAVRKFWRMRGSHNSHVTKMYVMVLLWWGSFVAANAYSIVIYVLSKNDESLNGEAMSTLTKYSFVITWLNAYVIQSILLCVPYHWGKQITELFSQAERNSDVALESPEEYNGLEKKIYLTMKYYIFFRVGFLALPVAFLMVNEGLFSIFFKIMISSLLLDCIFITFSLLAGMYSLKTTRQLREQIDDDEAKRMFNQYLMIILANTIRFAFDIMYVLNLVVDDLIYSQQCPNYGKANWLVEAVTNVCTLLLSHYFPIFIILRIYNLEEKPEEMCKSLLITTSDS